MAAIEAHRGESVGTESALFRCGEICAEIILREAGELNEWLCGVCSSLAQLPGENLHVWGAVISGGADGPGIAGTGSSDELTAGMRARLLERAGRIVPEFNSDPGVTRCHDDSAEAEFLDAAGFFNPLRLTIGIRNEAGRVDQVLVFEVASRRPDPDLAGRVRPMLEALAAPVHAALSRFHLAPLRYRRSLLSQLSPTQRRIAPLLARGLTEKQIAEELGRSPHTVHEHAKSIYSTWGVRTRFDLRDKWMGQPAMD